jgi:hypothetical protein
VDPPELYMFRFRYEELEAEAAVYRLARICARPPRPSRVFRIYARLWRAARPRADHTSGI